MKKTCLFEPQVRKCLVVKFILHKYFISSDNQSLADFDPTVESGVSDLQRIQIDDYDDQESSVDSTLANSLELSDSVTGSDDLNNVASDRSTDTITEPVESREYSLEYREEEESKIVQLIQASFIFLSSKRLDFQRDLFNSGFSIC